jgi:hypothetical protein
MPFFIFENLQFQQIDNTLVKVGHWFYGFTPYLHMFKKRFGAFFRI